MSYWTVFATLIKLLPELISIMKTLIFGIQSGVKTIKLKKDLTRISKALRVQDGKQSASDLNDVFRN